MKRIIGISSLSVPLFLTFSAVDAQDLAQQSAALKLISDTAADICYTIAQGAHQTEVSVNGEVGAKLPGLVGKIVDLGVKGAGEYKKKESEGVLQEELANAIKVSTNCRKDVFDKLVKRLVTAQPATAQPGALQQIGIVGSWIKNQAGHIFELKPNGDVSITMRGQFGNFSGPGSWERCIDGGGNLCIATQAIGKCSLRYSFRADGAMNLAKANGSSICDELAGDYTRQAQ